MKKNLKIPLLITLMLISAWGCQHDFIIQPQYQSNIILFGKPLPVIQEYITGTWNLQYSAGGLAYHKVVDTANTFWILTPTHISAFNNSGVYVNTQLIWTPATLYNEKAYLFSYNGSPLHYIVEQIKNDTLIIREYADDGFTYYFSKVRPL